MKVGIFLLTHLPIYCRVNSDPLRMLDHENWRQGGYSIMSKKSKVLKKDKVPRLRNMVLKGIPIMYRILVGPDFLDMAMASLKGKRVEFTLKTLPPMAKRSFVVKGTIKKTAQDRSIIVIKGFINLDGTWPEYHGRYNVNKRSGIIIVG